MKLHDPSLPHPQMAGTACRSQLLLHAFRLQQLVFVSIGLNFCLAFSKCGPLHTPTKKQSKHSPLEVKWNEFVRVYGLFGTSQKTVHSYNESRNKKEQKPPLTTSQSTIKTTCFQTAIRFRGFLVFRLPDGEDFSWYANYNWRFSVSSDAHKRALSRVKAPSRCGACLWASMRSCGNKFNPARKATILNSHPSGKEERQIEPMVE